MSDDFLTPKAREHFERASAKGCVCGLCELIAALPEILRKAKAHAWQDGHGYPECDEWVVPGMCAEFHPNPYKEEA